MEFSVVFSGKMELHFFPLRKRSRVNRIIWSEFSMPVGRGLGSYHANQKHGGWTSFRARRFIGRLGKLFFFFMVKKAIISSFVCCNIHISSGKPAISIHIVFPRCRLGGSTLEFRIMQVKEKHKYRPQNLTRSYLQGYSCVLKRPPTLLTSKDTHCNDERFGNLPPSLRSLAFFLGSITVKSQVL